MRFKAFLTAALCACLVLVACATPPPPVSRSTPADVSLPVDIGRLTIERSYDYPDPRLGVVYAYAGDFALTPDVYVYPNPFLAGRSSAEARTRSLALEAQRFRNEIERAVQQSHYDSATFHDTTDVRYTWSYGTVEGKRITLTIVKDGNSALSHAYIFPVADMLVKIRISHYEYFGLAGNMDWFAETLMAGLSVASFAGGPAGRAEAGRPGAGGPR